MIKKRIAAVLAVTAMLVSAIFLGFGPHKRQLLHSSGIQHNFCLY